MKLTRPDGTVIEGTPEELRAAGLLDMPPPPVFVPVYIPATIPAYPPYPVISQPTWGRANGDLICGNVTH